MGNPDELAELDAERQRLEDQLAEDPCGVPPRFQAGASWCANLAIINALRQLETTNVRAEIPQPAGRSGDLAGPSIYELSNMDGTIDAG